VRAQRGVCAQAAARRRAGRSHLRLGWRVRRVRFSPDHLSRGAGGMPSRLRRAAGARRRGFARAVGVRSPQHDVP
jgi:hypothetical protein